MNNKTQNNLSPVFIGLDLAWSARNPTGCAVIVENQLKALTWTLRGNDEILRFIESHLVQDCPAIIGIDAPLRVPNEGGARACDLAVSRDWRRFEAGALPANRQLLTQHHPEGKVRGEELVALLVHRLHFTEAAPIPLQTQDRIVCEIFPHPAHVSLFGLEKTLKYKARGRRSYEQRWSEMERYQKCLRQLRKAKPSLKRTKKLLKKTDVRALRGKALKGYEDALDAITCAYVVNYLWHHGPQYTCVYGNVADGHIIVPLTDEMKYRMNKDTE
ncbi:DUF429 domain-containing protein [Chloroflexi bacterium TSY]|nr:DUF429 domain-containing protein [Chloroflexi bacterium TSY]